MKQVGSKYHYSCLEEDEKIIYQKIYDAVLSFKPSITIKKIATSKLFEIINAIIYDQPLLFYWNNRNIPIIKTMLGVKLILKYDYQEAEVNLLWKQIQNQINEMMKMITPNMKPLTKQIIIHRWMQSHITIAKPPYDKDCHNIVGAFIKKCCVCEGFAQAYKLICDQLKIASIVVRGKAITPEGKIELHAWNMTRIDGICSHIDVTWDTVYGIGSYDYFNITDDEISVDHQFDRRLYPTCNHNELSYYVKNKMIANNKQELQQIIASNSHQNSFSVQLKYTFHVKDISNPIYQIRYNTARKVLFLKKRGTK